MELCARGAVSITAVPDCLFIAVFPLRPREQRERSRGVAVQAPIESGDWALRLFFFPGEHFPRVRGLKRLEKFRTRRWGAPACCPARRLPQTECCAHSR